MTTSIDLSEKNWIIVENILHQVLPSEAKVYAFGSRVKGRARRGSDLDLAFDLGRTLTRQEEFELADAFEESDLPIKVDVVDLHRVSPTFKAIVEEQMVEVVFDLPHPTRLQANPLASVPAK